MDLRGSVKIFHPLLGALSPETGKQPAAGLVEQIPCSK